MRRCGRKIWYGQMIRPETPKPSNSNLLGALLVVFCLRLWRYSLQTLVWSHVAKEYMFDISRHVHSTRGVDCRRPQPPNGVGSNITPCCPIHVAIFSAALRTLLSKTAKRVAHALEAIFPKCCMTSIPHSINGIAFSDKCSLHVFIDPADITKEWSFGNVKPEVSI